VDCGTAEKNLIMLTASHLAITTAILPEDHQFFYGDRLTGLDYDL